MTSTYTTNKNIEKPAYNDYAANPTGWSGPINTDWDIIDAAFGGVTVKNPTSVSGTVALTTSEYQKLILIIGVSATSPATLTANVTYTIPLGVGGQWIVYNNTTGAYTVTIAQASGGGSSVAVQQGARTCIYSDGTNVAIADDRISVPGSTSQVLYNSNGTLAASANMTFSGSNFAVSGSLTAGTTISDGDGNVRNLAINSQTTGYTLVASDNGKLISITTGGVTVPSSIFSAGNTITIYNNSASGQTITQGAGVTMRWVGTTGTGNRTLASYGLCTVVCVASNTFVISGGGLS